MASRPASSMHRAARAALGVGAALLVPLTLFAVPRAEAVAVLGAPGSTTPDVARIVAEAGGFVIRGGSLSNVLVAQSEERGFVLRLYAAGAWLVLDPLAAELCGSAFAAARPRTVSSERPDLR